VLPASIDSPTLSVSPRPFKSPRTVSVQLRLNFDRSSSKERTTPRCCCDTGWPPTSPHLAKLKLPYNESASSRHSCEPPVIACHPIARSPGCGASLRGVWRHICHLTAVAMSAPTAQAVKYNPQRLRPRLHRKANRTAAAPMLPLGCVFSHLQSVD
jgi:hypothetical protein